MPKKKYNRNNRIKTQNKHDTEDEIKKIESRIQMESPAPGTGIQSSTSQPFSALPLSRATLDGLSSDQKTTMTEIQASTIPHALADRDILASARTGSGKTLAFAVPLLERLYRKSFWHTPSLGGIVLSPTRELASQIFSVVRTVGKSHSLSAGLLIGGAQEFQKEQLFLHKTNILVATPGRLLQHLEQTPGFDAGTLEVLVLDEADRILDMGFQTQLERILEYLPRERQTMLFSATQTRKVKDLARLSLNKPEYIFVHQKEEDASNIAASLPPSSLEQLYMVIPLEHKLDLLFSFLKTHLQSRIIVFFATCAQVRHAHALFCALRPGIPLLALHGKLHQKKRLGVYRDFVHRDHAALFCTDVAGRGLDFPKVNWVISVDAPESRFDYIHRVGRTARYHSKGKSVLFLLPSEEKPFIELLKHPPQQAISIQKVNVNPKKAFRISTANVAGSIIAKHAEYGQYAKKAFQSYLRSYTLMPEKHIFDLEKLKSDEYAYSLGLGTVPSMRFLHKIRGKSREERRTEKNQNHKLMKLKQEIMEERLQKKKRRNEETPPPKTEEDDFLVPKQQSQWDSAGMDSESKPIQPRKSKKQRIHIHPTTNKITFDEDGNEIQPTNFFDNTSTDHIHLHADHEDYIKSVQERLDRNKELDTREEKLRIKEKHRKRRLDGKKLPDKDDDHDDGVQLDYSEDESSSEDNESEDSNDDVDIQAQEDIALSMIRGKL